MKPFLTPFVPAAVAALACTVARAEPKVVVFPAGESITTEQTLTLTAAMTDAAGLSSPAPIRWEWRVLETGEFLAQDEQGRGLFRPPAVVLGGEETCTIQARALSLGGLAGETKATVRNGVVMGRLMAGFLGKDWLEPRLELLAGSPGKDGYRRGAGEAARLGDIADLVHVPHHPDPRIEGNFLALDRQNNCVLVVDRGTGAVWTWLGADPSADRGGSSQVKDGKGLEARFLGPSRLAIRPGGGTAGIPWQCVIADSMGFLIRSVDGQGQVTTLSEGPHSLGPGWRGQPRTFNIHGLAMDRDGAVYVADGTSRAILKLSGKDRFEFFAGVDQGRKIAPEPRDGSATEALFSGLEGLALDEATGNLYVCDYNAIRRISPKGEVTTVAGRLGDPEDCAGFEAHLDDSGLPEGPARLAGVRCLDQPCGITISRGEAFIAEAGNGTIRVLDLATGRLSTLAGDPARRSTRFGVLRNGRTPAPEGCALLGSPGRVAFDGRGEACLAALRTCIGELVLDRRGRPAAAAAGARTETKGEGKEERKQEVLPGIVRAADF